ncbi:hypothetical protein JZ751_025477 [Albula glossodonta]|uniref:RRM domain-containing protein n=1 Tax=Albula glossodonta TaxID=121402 RepID=A0A8T2NEE0_9TELE|nr:hypothetical protein JZ751_025477 [Albula glossodonta]
MANIAAAVVAAAGRDPAVDRSLRSVFVGNIPYEATEEQLKDIFSEVGLVVSFRLVYDRETGKPKGYGFCLGTGAPVIESPYGDGCQPEEAPESISRAVASLPPEQMFELMKQMKLCVQNSPQEARNMLLQNPQLAYALLQAQVVMRIVDPEIALKMLHRQTTVQPLIPSSQAGVVPVPSQPLSQPSIPVSQPQPMPGMHVNGAPQMMQPPQMVGVVAGPMPGQGPMGPSVGMQQPQMGIPQGAPVPMDRGQGNPQLSPVGPSGQSAIERPQVPMADPRAPMRGGVPPGPAVVAPRGLLGDGPNDPRGGTLLSVTGEVVEPSGPPPEMRGPHDMRGGPMVEPRGMMGEPRGPMMEQRGPPMEARAPIPGARDPRAVEARSLDARGPAPGLSGVPQTGAGGFSPGQSQVTSQDHEKAALIMQVLQLTPEQIAMLPPEQRQSILILKEQIQKTAGAP